MSNEIKEILDNLEIVARKHTIEMFDDNSKIETMPASVVDELRLNNFSAKLLLDYITNLQQELERYKHYSKTTGIEELMQENEYLKKHQRFHKKFGNDYIFCVEGDKETYKDLLLEKQEELEDYKSRVEKAIEYINKFESIRAYYEYIDEDGYDEYNYDEDFKEDLLELLQGGKDDNN